MTSKRQPLPRNSAHRKIYPSLDSMPGSHADHSLGFDDDMSQDQFGMDRDFGADLSSDETQAFLAQMAAENDHFSYEQEIAAQFHDGFEQAAAQETIAAGPFPQLEASQDSNVDPTLFTASGNLEQHNRVELDPSSGDSIPNTNWLDFSGTSMFDQCAFCEGLLTAHKPDCVTLPSQPRHDPSVQLVSALPQPIVQGPDAQSVDLRSTMGDSLLNGFANSSGTYQHNADLPTEPRHPQLATPSSSRSGPLLFKASQFSNSASTQLAVRQSVNDHSLPTLMSQGPVFHNQLPAQPTIYTNPHPATPPQIPPFQGFFPTFHVASEAVRVHKTLLNIPNDDWQQVKTAWLQHYASRIYDALTHRPAPATQEFKEPHQRSYFDFHQNEYHSALIAKVSASPEVAEARAILMVQHIVSAHEDGIPTVAFHRTAVKDGIIPDLHLKCSERAEQVINAVSQDKYVADDVFNGELRLSDLAMAPVGFVTMKKSFCRNNANKAKNNKEKAEEKARQEAEKAAQAQAQFGGAGGADASGKRQAGYEGGRTGKKQKR